MSTEMKPIRKIDFFVNKKLLFLTEIDFVQHYKCLTWRIVSDVIDIIMYIWIIMYC